SDPHGGGDNCLGIVGASQGYNIDSGSSCGVFQTGDHSNSDPLLGSTPGDHGGPTQTLALLTGSPAIAAGGGSAGDAVDQRGLPRPGDLAPASNAPGSDGTDIGAFEVQGAFVPPPTSTTPPASTPPATPTTPLKKCKKAKRRAAAAKKKCRRKS